MDIKYFHCVCGDPQHLMCLHKYVDDCESFSYLVVFTSPLPYFRWFNIKGFLYYLFFNKVLKNDSLFDFALNEEDIEELKNIQLRDYDIVIDNTEIFIKPKPNKFWFRLNYVLDAFLKRNSISYTFEIINGD